MTDKKTEALKLALEALEHISSHYMSLPKIGCMALAAVEEALAEQPAQQEPVAWMGEQLQMLNFLYGSGDFDGVWFDQKHPAEKGAFWWRKHLRRLFTSPPTSKPWVGLTEQERNDLEDYCEMIIGKAAFEAIEAKLREKNA